MNLKSRRPNPTHNPLTGHAGANTHRTTCSRCGRTVFTDQETEWSTDPWALGIVHTDCEETA